MAARLEMLKEQFFDDDGAVLSGGKLNTYTVGTTTAKATYTTVLGDVEQANPVVLDSDGRIPSDLYGVGAYKIVITDSADTTIDTIPTVSGVNSASMTTIGDYSGDFDAAITAISTTATTLYVDDTATMSAAVTVPATCTVVLEKGGVIVMAANALTFNGPLIVHGGTITNNATLTINAHFTDTIFQVFTTTGTVAFGASSIGFRRPEWFYSGSGLYTTAFERAIVSDSVVELVGGKTYSMSPEGITNCCNITGKNNWTLNGNGATLKFDDNVETGAILYIDDCDDVRINDVEFDGNVSGGTAGAREALAIRQADPADATTAACNRMFLSNLYIHDTQSGATEYAASGIRAIGTNDLSIKDCIIDNTDCGIIIRQTTDVSISGCIMNSGGTSESISVWGDSDEVTNTNVSITNCVLNKQLLISFADRCTVTGCVIDGMGIGGEMPLNLKNIANNVVVSGNTIYTRVNIGSQNNTLTDITANDILISNNVFDLEDTYGINILYKAHGIAIVNNYFKLTKNATAVIAGNPTGDPATNVHIIDNVIDMNSFTLTYGIYTDAVELSIIGNVILGAPTTGIWVETAAGDMDDVYILNNVIPDKTIRCDQGAPKIIQGNYTNATAYSVASANALTLHAQQISHDGYFHITGTTAVTSITATRAGHLVTLTFAGILTFTHGSNLVLAGAANLTTAAGSTIQLICNGTNWYEVSRSTNS